MIIQINDPWFESIYYKEFGGDKDKFLAEIKEILMQKYQSKLSKEEIKKIVENSQRIEGYEPVSKEIEEEAKALIRRYNVQISA
jgi:hypothetical protein